MSAVELSPPLRLWSVTTLLKQGLGTGPGLINWIAEQIAIAGVDKQRVVRQILEDDGRDAAIKYVLDHRWRKSDEAKLRGTDVHRVAEAIALGLEPPIPIDDRIAPYVEQYERWLKQHRPTFLMAEAPVYNVTRRYAGTCDGVMVLGGKRLLFDYKTTDRGPDSGKSRPPYSEVALQLVAYARAELVGVLAEQRYDGRSQRYYLFDPTVEHEAMPPVDGALCIVISPYDCVAVPVRIDDNVWRAFLHVQQTAHWATEGSKGVFGAPLVAPREINAGRETAA